jgi:SAM-dependent methyltransferase
MIYKNAKIGPRMYSLGDESSLKIRLQLAFQKFKTKLSYELINRKNFDGTFMNYGFAGVGSSDSGVVLDPNDEQNRYSIQLYNRVVEEVDLRGKDVLEIGSGRGGGSSFVFRYRQPRSMTGVDFSSKAVAFCNGHHRLQGLSFQVGDAENLSFPTRSFDAVVNVESSHCYSSVERFLEQVVRVLRPGGYLLLADFRPEACVAAFREQLTNCGLSLVEEEDITQNVLLGLETTSDRKREWIEREVRARLRPIMSKFSALKGSPIFEAFRTGECRYLRFVLQKPID